MISLLRRSRQAPVTISDARAQRDEELEGLSLLTYHERLTQFARGSTKLRIDNSVTVIDFRPLYAINVHHLQRQLAQEIRFMQEDVTSERQLIILRKLLEQYTNALRDFEFIHSNRWNTHFVKDIAASRLDNGCGSKLQAALISELDLDLPKDQQPMYSDNDLLGSFDHSLLQHSAVIGRTRATTRQIAEAAEERTNRSRHAWRRFMFAVVGGLAIVGPALIIVVDKVAVKTLAVVSSSIFLFAVGVAVFSSAEPEHLLAATAAYSACLMAFLQNGTAAGSSQG